MRQVSLDVELWVSEELQSELAAAHGVTYHSLTDYDLQVAEVIIILLTSYVWLVPIKYRCVLAAAVQC